MSRQNTLSAGYLRQFILLAVAFGVLCSAIRWGYLTEPVRHQLAATVGDDSWHIQELNSLVNSATYPARSSFAPTNYLSFYYAPWIPAVAFYFALPMRVVTLTTALFFVNALYDLLLPLALLGIAVPLARSQRQMSWAIYLIGFWSGVQSLYSVQRPFRDDTWPLRDLFGLNLQFSNFATLMVWVVHHTCSAVALLLAYTVWRSGGKVRRMVFCPLLLAFSVYSSAFVCLGAAPFLVLIAIREARRQLSPILLVLSCAAILTVPMLWMFLRKPEGVAFQMPLHHDRWMQLPQWLLFPAFNLHYGYLPGAALFLILIAAQFFFAPWALARGWNCLSQMECGLIAISVAYLLSTYFVGFSGANNYCMRGGILPSITLCWIASSHLPHPRTAIGVLLIAGSMGTWQTIEYELLRTVALYFNPPPYLVNSNAVIALNQDRSRKTVDLSGIPGMQRYPSQLPYYIQKMPLETWPVLAPADQELQSAGPSGIWSWQKR